MQLNLPSPLQKIADPLFDEKGLEVFIKRDDLIHPLVSGNKWRKLKYILQKAQAEQKTHLVTFGGAFSNHLLATAAAAQMAGLQSTGMVRGEEVLNETLRQCRASGMNLIFTDRVSYRDKKNLFEHNFGNNTNTFFIDEGGASAEGVKGCSELWDELNEKFDHVFCSAGTGTTVAGLNKGIKKRRLNTRLHVVPALKNGEFLLQEIQKYTPVDEQLIHHTDYHFGGYAKSTAELLQFLINFYHQNQILLDPVYTAKMMFALYDLIKKDYFPSGSRILTIHTGGLMGLLGMQEKIYEIDPDFRQILEQYFRK